MPHKLNIIHDTQGGVAIDEAVETLADIAELKFDKDNASAKIEEIAEHNKEVVELTAKKMHLSGENPDAAIKALRGTFHTILEYIRNFYKHDSSNTGNQKAVEGVKGIMVIVGEAAQRLDKYTSLFSQTKEKSVANLKEYKQLQDFYLNRIVRKIDQGVLGKWILELAKDAMSRSDELQVQEETTTQTSHIFMDLVMVKNDTGYELFFLRKEDGTRFFSPRLIRNIKLVCDIENKISKEPAIDPLESLQVWEDRLSNDVARSMIRSIEPAMNNYFHETKTHVRWDIVRDINKALMALLLSSNSKNLMGNSPVKTSFEYFNDFLGFLRESMLSKEYQKWIAYPPKKSNTLAHAILDITHELCHALMTNNLRFNDISIWLQKLLDKVDENHAKEKPQYIWGSLLDEHVKMNKLLKMHPNGPLIKVLDIIKQGGYYGFDPISQYNIPDQLYSLYVNEKKMTNLRIPSPTFQEFIHKAFVIEEFKGFLRFYNSESTKRKHLLINLQDRTSWKEHFRSVVLEDLQNQQEFENVLTVVSLSKDTEFYEQSAPYAQENHANIFIKLFKEQLEDENCGFYFPKEIKKQIFPKFVSGIIAEIHRIFFSNKNVLTVGNRRDFIELFYLFLELKLLDILDPDTFSLTCKDGIDVSGAANAQLCLFMKMIHGEPIHPQEIQKINAMINIPPLLIRERVIIGDRFNRMIEVLKLIEYTQKNYGPENFAEIIKEGFGLFYKTPILSGAIEGLEKTS